MKRPALLAAAALVAAALAGCGHSDAGRPLVVHLTIHHSHYLPERVVVPRGAEVRFVITNTDPIDHEWILGSPAVQARHERGTEPRHASIPTERSIDALTTVTTTVVFADAGSLEYACHLPGHYAYGMRGTLVVS